MIACSRCGRDNDQDSRFCVACGSPLSRRSSRAPSAAVAVVSSGAPWEPDISLSSGPPKTNAAQVALVDSLAFAQTSPPASRQLGSPSTMGASDSPRSSAPAADEAQALLHHLDIPVEAPPVLAGFLVSYDANPLGQFWPIHQGSNLIGRVGAGADADIEFPHATVSSRHAIIVAAALPGRMLLTDQGSTNGTFVDDVALQPDQHWPLKDGDTVRFGLFSATVKIVH